MEYFFTDLLYISRNKLLRTYPKGSRVESSNFNPMPMWKVGIQMASVNFQKPGTSNDVLNSIYLFTVKASILN